MSREGGGVAAHRTFMSVDDDDTTKKYRNGYDRKLSFDPGFIFRVSRTLFYFTNLFVRGTFYSLLIRLYNYFRFSELLSRDRLHLINERWHFIGID